MLNPELWIAASIDPTKVVGWIYTQVPMKSASHLSSWDTRQQFLKRIVFQLDVSLDTFHYRIWTNAVNSEGTMGVIREFRKSLRQCRFVHPDDIGACEQALDAQSDKHNISALDLRLIVGSSRYLWYRLYTVTPENPQDQIRTISGVLVALQSLLGGVRRNSDKLYHDHQRIQQPL